ncbi:hypothetical protein D1007_18965 [Hordeum vulgare]|nr:hypothetical protein D1007_18965 [Hordeum vulgare]KAI4966587.1 hypothetical protein ZWY2020_038006 [Hordeum vulgare]KAI4978319.1 hypothetical protein ZWY2020_014873 [Hordeum vulgare]
MVHQARQGRRGRRLRHVRLGSLLRLRVRLFRLAGLVVRCMEELRCCPGIRRRTTPGSAGQPAALRGTESSASFHADQAIADCLEFIKRSYLQQPVQDDDHHTTFSS